ncbi:DUF580-domain-containing protein [Cystobasidium minutum MCA 4210]|uniref:DUF580-domain-containing protein n=1 Tax=Cystobasidium minutum MCA 4210 TaxID=1397322 RepID=UPI0034CF5E17|eukprot:jgi/Rhomi1/165706/fgenesh1_kg.1_\
MAQQSYYNNGGEQQGYYGGPQQGGQYYQQQQQQQQPYYPDQAYQQQGNNGGYYNGPPQMQGGQQQYPQPTSAYQQQPPSAGIPPVKPEYPNGGEMFTPTKPKWNDIIFLILFWAQFGAFVALSVICLRAVGDSGGSIGGDSDGGLTLNLNTAYLLALIAAAGFVLSIVLLWIAKTFTKIILEICLLLSVAFSIGYAIYLWVEHYWSGAIIFTILAVISIICYFPMRRRIPLSKLLLQFVFKIAGQHKSVYGIALLTTLLQAMYSVWWGFTIVAVYQKYSPDSDNGCNTSGGTCGNGAVICACIFSVFSFYWTTQVIQNVSLTTIAGVFGSYYFSMPGERAVHAARSSFRRAMTYSFGSIAEGSLIVALLDLLKAGLTLLRQQEQQSGDVVGAAIACCAECCIGCIRWLVDYFNRYAYIEIAMFGKSYIQAAKDAWHLLKDRGIDALVNDSLVNNIWLFGSYAVGALCSLFAYLYVHLEQPSYIQGNSNYTAVILFYAFIVGFQISHSLGYVALSSGVSTIFVALGEAPQALAEKDPALFSHIAANYPKVMQPV